MREINEARANKGAQEAASERIQRARRRVLVAIPVAAAALAVAWVYTRVVRAQELARALDGPTALFAARGFVTHATGEGELEETLEPGCFVAVTPDDGDGKLSVDHAGETLEGERSIGWCSCTEERATFHSEGPMRVLRVDGKAVGNVDGLGAAEPKPRVVSGRTEDCAAEQLDAWLAEKKHASADVDPTPFEADPALMPLRVAGFVPIAVLPKGDSFAVVDGPTESCFLAFGGEPAEPIGLRLRGGARPIGAPGAIGWCSQKAQSVTVWRQGTGEVRVVAAPAERVGGVLGLHERALRAKLPNLAPWVSPDELGWDAVVTLQGSAVDGAEVALSGTATESTPADDAHLVAISLAPGGAWAADRRGPYFCDPPTGALQTLCAELAPQTWRQSGAPGALAIARAPLPFWLTIFAGVEDPELPRSLVALLMLARRLRGDGFEPTTLAGVVEEPNGVSVNGRAGDDAIVAVGLGPVAPYVFPYSDGAEWQLTGEPRVVELAPGERAVLSNVEAPTATPEQRRTVVFRRAVKRRI